MARRDSFRQRLRNLSSVQKVAALVLVLASSIAVLGHLNQHYGLDLEPVVGAIIADFYANVSTEMASIAIAVLVIDSLNERRAEQELKAQLIREMGHPTDNGVALRAVRELRAHGWLEDGSLRETNLEGANLQGADLRGANLKQANLLGAKLERANLHEANLHEAKLEQANLIGADLLGADLAGVNLQGAKLERANVLRFSCAAVIERGGIRAEATFQRYRWRTSAENHSGMGDH